jgi:hypothetical protein
MAQEIIMIGVVLELSVEYSESSNSKIYDRLMSPSTIEITTPIKNSASFLVVSLH